VVVTLDTAALWTDGRYFLQGEKELGPDWQLMRAGTPGCPEVGRDRAEQRSSPARPAAGWLASAAGQAAGCELRRRGSGGRGLRAPGPAWPAAPPPEPGPASRGSAWRQARPVRYWPAKTQLYSHAAAAAAACQMAAGWPLPRPGLPSGPGPAGPLAPPAPAAQPLAAPHHSYPGAARHRHHTLCNPPPAPRPLQIEDWLASTLPEGGRVGIDPFCHTIDGVRRLQRKLEAAGGAPGFGRGAAAGSWCTVAGRRAARGAAAAC
jgi:hypothetical protein